MSILTIDHALSRIDEFFREKIVSSYKEIKSRYTRSVYSLEYDTTGLSTGKFCENVFRFLQQTLTGRFIPFGTHITNFNDECSSLIKLPKSSGNESLRVIIPRALQFLYTMRGKRGIGHVGGDVEANRIDTETIVRMADWIICELIRSFHSLSLEEAQAIVDTIAEKTVPEVWEIAGKKRILVKNLDNKEKTLLLLYHSTENYELENDLCEWVEYSGLSMYKKRILEPLHAEKLIEFDKVDGIIYIYPRLV